MPIIAPAWTGTLFGLLAAKGLVGTELIGLASSIGNGSATSIMGKSVTTTDTGMNLGGPGSGIGVGLVVTPAAITGAVFANCVAKFGKAGSKLYDICDAIGTACQINMAMAMITTTSPSVTIGAGVVIPSSIGVVGSAMGSAIMAMGSANGMLGKEWTNMANSIGEGTAMGIKSTAVGMTVITGVPISPIPIPMGGSGVGTIL